MAKKIQVAISTLAKNEYFSFSPNGDDYAFVRRQGDRVYWRVPGQDKVESTANVSHVYVY